MEAICPSCGVVLEKKPARKTKCRACGEAILVRTRPSDRQQVLVTEPQAEELQREWQLVMASTQIKPTFPANALEPVRASLTKKWGRPPSERDVIWSYLNHMVIEYARDRHWGLYRNNQLSIAAHLVQEGQLDRALRFYFGVSILDANGPENNGSARKDFNPAGGRLAPLVLTVTDALALRLGLDEILVRNLFFEVAEELNQHLKLPLSADAEWEKFECGGRAFNPLPNADDE